MDELLALKSVADSQAQMDQYAQHQEKLFQKLLAAVQQKRLKPSTSKASIIFSYGEPISSKYLDELQAKEMMMYRHPLELLGSEKVFLYLDKNKRLIKWEYEAGD